VAVVTQTRKGHGTHYRLHHVISAMILAFFCSSASLLMSLNTSSISSSVLPAVSGMHKNVKKKASRQKTAKKVYAPAPVFWIRGGVMRPYNRLASQCNTRRKKQRTMRKLLNQLEQVESATPFALRELGKISDGMAHGTGPHVAPNENM
jgi:hypothetical protein